MTISQKANALFRERYGDAPNVLTPHILDRRMVAAGRLAVEISSGEGFSGQPLYGVTVLVANDVRDPRGHDMSQTADSYDAACAYVETLRKWRP